MPPNSGPAACCGRSPMVKYEVIVVGNRGMTGMRRMLGSVPNTISHHAPCSVLIVQTDASDEEQ